jgi:hypothetical protein
MGAVFELVTPERVETAWTAYQQLAVQLRDDPHLIADRTFNQDMARAHEKWRRLYLRQGHTA